MEPGGLVAWTRGYQGRSRDRSPGSEARDFAIRRLVNSGSWLGREFQGQGLGTEARAAVLALAFDGLDAEAAESGYIGGNAASARVSEKPGYRIAGDEVFAIEGKRALEIKVRCTRETWQRELVPVTIEGLEPCLRLDRKSVV